MSTGPQRPSEIQRHSETQRRSDLLAVVFVGGCVGGYVRYAVTSSWAPGRSGFPWSTFTVNLAGALVLGLLIAFVSAARPTRYLRPLVGTGFCGALTTFSSVVVVTNELVAHHHAATGVGYLLASAVGGLLAATLGLAAGRSMWGPRVRRTGGS